MRCSSIQATVRACKFHTILRAYSRDLAPIEAYRDRRQSEAPARVVPDPDRSGSCLPEGAALAPRGEMHRDRADRSDQCNASAKSEGRHCFAAYGTARVKEVVVGSRIDVVRGNCVREGACCFYESRRCLT